MSDTLFATAFNRNKPEELASDDPVSFARRAAFEHYFRHADLAEPWSNLFDQPGIGWDDIGYPRVSVLNEWIENRNFQVVGFAESHLPYNTMSYSESAFCGSQAPANYVSRQEVWQGFLGANQFRFGHGPVSGWHRGGTPIVLSREILSNALRFVSWLPDWDGEAAERVDPELALNALDIANRMSPVAGEPKVAPAIDGSLLLEWDFAGGSTIEVFVETAGIFPDCAVLEDGDLIEEIELSNGDDLQSLLRAHSLSAHGRE